MNEPQPKTPSAKETQRAPVSDLPRAAATMRDDGPGLAESRRARVPGYEILEELGRGGMGVVYKARQSSLNRLVALKMILSGAHAAPHELARFRAEAEAVARLDHPNIVQVYEFGDLDEQPFMVLELLDTSLARKVAGTPVPARQAAQWIESLARAAHFAHERGIIHRDLKPGNILVSRDGVVKITDFGTAKNIWEHALQTRTGAVFGTPSYMAPEQAEGKTRQIGPLADVYALGAMLYELLTGRAPFVADSPHEILEQVRLREPVPPSKVQPSVPRDLETICLRCLAKQQQQRYLSAAALADDLKAFLAGEPIQARAASPWERLASWARRRPVEAALLTFAAMTLVGLVVGLIWFDAVAMAGIAGLSLVAGSAWYSARLQGALSEVTRQQALTERNVERLHLVLNLTRRLMRATQPDELLQLLADTTVQLTDAEFATIYLVDRNRGELWSKVLTEGSLSGLSERSLSEGGLKEIRLRLGVGIAGTVAATGQPINIPDAYADPRFNPAVDKQSGKTTRNLLTVPLTAQDGAVLGVFQVMNKRDGAFGVEDIEMLSSLAESASITLADLSAG